MCLYSRVRPVDQMLFVCFLEFMDDFRLIQEPVGYTVESAMALTQNTVKEQRGFSFFLCSRVGPIDQMLFVWFLEFMDDFCLIQEPVGYTVEAATALTQNTVKEQKGFSFCLCSRVGPIDQMLFVWFLEFMDNFRLIQELVGKKHPFL